MYRERKIEKLRELVQDRSEGKGQPFTLNDLLGSWAFFRLMLQHPFYYFLRRVGDVLRHSELASSDSMEQLLVSFTIERVITG